MKPKHTPRKIERGSNSEFRVLRRRLAHRLAGRDERRLLFIACFPKSGSTYLMELLCTVTGFPRLAPLQAMGPNEQEMDRREIRRIRHWDGVCQQHMKGTRINLELARRNNLRIAILTRDIHDVLYSLYDHLHDQFRDFPTGYTTEEFFGLPEDEKFTYLIRLHLPWYFNFLLSWHEGQAKVPCRWVSYEELMADRVGTVSDLLRFWDVPRTERQIEDAVEVVKSRSTRLNKGVVGRGRALSPEHREAILDLANACRLPDELRARVGLPTAAETLPLWPRSNGQHA